jgi:toll-like receptor 13
MSRIKYLDLSNNEIKQQNIYDLFYLRNLEYLDFSLNQLSEIINDAFTFNTRLIELKLNNNKIQAIELNAFATLENLEKLDLSYNLLEKIDATTFNPM